MFLSLLPRTLEAFPIAEQKFQELKEALSGQDLELDALLSAEKLPESVLEQQIMLFAFLMVLSDLLQGLGLQIHAVVGHSAGELPCAYLAGALTLQDAVNLLSLGKRLRNQGVPNWNTPLEFQNRENAQKNSHIFNAPPSLNVQQPLCRKSSAWML